MVNNNRTLGLIVVYIFLLGLILFTYSINLGISLVLGTEILALITSVSLIKDIKKIKKSLSSKILSVVLINFALYGGIILFYCASNFFYGRDTEGAGLIVGLLMFLLIIPSFIVEIIWVVKDKSQTMESSPNKILLIIIVIYGVLFYYSFTVSSIAQRIGSPDVCKLHIEINGNAKIFSRGMQDSCILQVGANNGNIDQCKLIRDYKKREDCIMHATIKLNDASLCYQVTEESGRQAQCFRNVAGKVEDISMCENPGIPSELCYSNMALRKNEPEICNYIKNNESKYECYSKIAMNKKDVSICEKYFPSNASLIKEGVDHKFYSKAKCITDVNQGHF